MCWGFLFGGVKNFDTSVIPEVFRACPREGGDGNSGVNDKNLQRAALQKSILTRLFDRGLKTKK